ncbi:MAG: DUF4097 family beta strand repeat-containing protein [Gemmatimonadota bacterium]
MLTLSKRIAALTFAAVVTSAVGAETTEAQRREAAPFAWEGAIASGQALEIKGVNGQIRATPASGNTVRVEATRSARRSDPSEIDIVVLEHAGGVTVCAVYPSSLMRENECAPGDAGRISARNNDTQVEFTVQVPAGVDFVGQTTNGSVIADNLSGHVMAYSTNGDVEIDGGRTVHARTTNGSVTIRSAGEADARTTNGRIRAYLQSLDGSGPLNFSTTNGSITLGLPASANVNVDASTTNGRISSDLPITVTGSIGRNRLAGTIGSGGREIRLRTTNGSIDLQTEG